MEAVARERLTKLNSTPKACILDHHSSIASLESVYGTSDNLSSLSTRNTDT